MSFPFGQYDKDIQRLEDELTSLMRQRLDGDDSEALRRKDNRNNYFESDIRIMV